MEKKIDDDELITALLSSPSKAEAARRVGITPRTVFNRLNDEGFRKKLEAAKEDRATRLSDLMDTATACALEKAIFVLETDPNSSVAVMNDIDLDKQLSVVKTILQGYGKH